MSRRFGDYDFSVAGPGIIQARVRCGPKPQDGYIHTTDDQFMAAMQSLGWTPPGEKAKVRLTKEDAGAACRLMFNYDNLADAHREAVCFVAVPFQNGGSFQLELSPAELRASIDRQKKEAQDALVKLGIEYP